MAHILNLTRDDPVVHIKAYGGLRVKGVDQAEMSCEISAPQLASLVEENGHVYVTVNSACRLTVPVKSSIEIERGMGSVMIENVAGPINVEKVLGNLVLIEVNRAVVDKLGGSFSVRKASGAVQIEKIAGNLTLDDVQAFSCEKVGGNCKARNIQGDFHIEKAGGNCKLQGVAGLVSVAKLGGSLKAREITLRDDIKVGGNIELNGCKFENDLILQAGGDVTLALPQEYGNLSFKIRSGGRDIKVHVREDDIEVHDFDYVYQLGEGDMSISITAVGSVSITDTPDTGEDLIGDLSDHFTFEESAFSEMIQERIVSATRRAEAKVKAAEIRLEQMQDQLEQKRGFKVDVGFDDEDFPIPPPSPKQPIPPMTRPAGKKGATDEERLMILKMLQDGNITVDDAETLFKAMES